MAKSKAQKIIEGLTILMRHGEADICADHDIIYAGGDDPGNVPPEDAATLEALDWFIDGSNKTWAIFT